MMSVGLQGGIVTTGDFFLFFINDGGERSVEKGKRLGRGRGNWIVGPNDGSCMKLRERNYWIM